MPIAPNTMANSSPDLTRAWRMICAASSLAGRPEPEKIGSFCPRTSVFRPSIAEMPVSMKSAGCSRVYGLIGAPVMSRRFSGMIGAPPSIGLPVPFRMRPSSSGETSIFATSSRKRTSVFATSMPRVPSKTWMTATSSGDLEDLARAARAVGHPDGDHLVVRDAVNVVHEQQRAGDVGDGPVVGGEQRAARRVRHSGGVLRHQYTSIPAICSVISWHITGMRSSASS